MPLRLSLILFAFIVLVAGRQDVQAQVSSYEELQAAYLYNFAKYIKWPDESEVFVIGVYGNKATIMPTLESTIKGRKVYGREIVLRVITTPQEVSVCQIVYLPEQESRNINLISQAMTGKTTLLVTEEDLIKKGAMISFVVEDDMLRFKLKKSALSQTGLVISEGLWKLAILF